MKRLLPILCLLLATLVRAQPQPAPADAILIVGISPETFVDAQETEVTVTIAYHLDSSDEGVIDLSSNELQANGFSPFAHHRVQKGSGTVSLTGKMMPRYWTPSVPAKIHVSLRSSTADPVIQRRPLASDDMTIAVARPDRPPEKHPENPNPSEVYADTISIKSVTPVKMREGQETLVTVIVTYELLSREEGQINLGYNEGRGNGYRIIGSTLIKIGQGEATLQAKILPAKTGPLPFSKVFVNLSEYPHRQSWSPLAGDSQVVEIH